VVDPGSGWTHPVGDAIVIEALEAWVAGG
jgi:hypothetical protein